MGASTSFVLYKYCMMVTHIINSKTKSVYVARQEYA